MRRIELNGRDYFEAEHGKFEACLITNGEMIAYTAGDTVKMLSGSYNDVALWADSYGINNIEGVHNNV